MSEQFIKTDLELLEVPGLSPRLRELYGRLRFHGGKDRRCFVRHVRLAEEIGLKDPKWVTRLLARLRELKLIEWTRAGPYFNEYRILSPDVSWIASFLAQHRPMREVADRPHPEVADRPPIKEVLLKEVFKRTSHTLLGGPPTPGSALSKIPRSETGDHPEWFTQFWSAYWRKVSRKSALKAFQQHVRTPERFAQVMAAIKTQTATMMAREPDHRPHAATWLNAERWNDEPSAPATRKPPQSSLVERTKALMKTRIARGERPI